MIQILLRALNDIHRSTMLAGKKTYYANILFQELTKIIPADSRVEMIDGYWCVVIHSS